MILRLSNMTADTLHLLGYSNNLQISFKSNKVYLCAMSKNSVQQFGEKDFQWFCINLSMFKLFLAIISPIMQVAPPFEQFLIKHTQELFVCNI